MFHYFHHLSDIIFGHTNKFVLIELQSKNRGFLAGIGLRDLIFKKVGHVLNWWETMHVRLSLRFKSNNLFVTEWLEDSLHGIIILNYTQSRRLTTDLTYCRARGRVQKVHQRNPGDTGTDRCGWIFWMKIQETLPARRRCKWSNAKFKNAWFAVSKPRCHPSSRV